MTGPFSDPVGQDPLRFDDAAYVLGLLPAADRERFEAHLAGCDECARRVAELADVPPVLAAAGRADVLAELEATVSPLPDTLLPGLLRRAARERRRRFTLVGALAGVAAACVIALAVALWPSAGSPPAGRPRALTALTATPLRASATLVQRPWGTQIALDCRYASGASGAAYAYGLVVIDRSGAVQQLGTWTVPEGPDTRYTSGTSLPLDRIAAVEVTYGGRPILKLATT